MTFAGHELAWAQWRAALSSSRMHHAWILSGPKGLGKGAFARAAASGLVAQAGVHQPDVAHHPDILIPEHPPENKEEARKREEGRDYRVKRSIPVDEIRALQHRLFTRPTLGTRRAVIIDPADDLERNAANALLKCLEEPPEGTYFLLVTHRIGQLLPTLRSRCRVLRFAQLGDEAIDGILLEGAPEAGVSERQAAIAAAQGSPGTALEFVRHDLGGAHAAMERILHEGDRDFALRGLLSEEIGARPDRDRLLAMIELARAAVSARLRAGGREHQLRVIDAHSRLNSLAAQAPVYNFDPGLVAMEIGALLASAAMPREAAI